MSAEQIEAEAVFWFVRNHDEGDPDPAFDAWLAIDPAREAAYARVAAVWASGSLATAANRVKRRRSRKAMIAAAAPVVVLVMAGGEAARLQGWTPAVFSDASTRIGAMSSSTLPDGTRLVLDTASAVDIAYTDGERVLHLKQGRLFVDVAVDDRPFSVISGGAVIRDIGTGFSAKRAAGTLQVAVRDGEVEVRNTHRTDTTSAIRITAGRKAEWTEAGPGALQSADAFEDFGWTGGRLYFSDRALSDVVDELRPYHRGWILIADDRIGETRISGGLSLQDPSVAVAELATLSGARLIRAPGSVLILR